MEAYYNGPVAMVDNIAIEVLSDMPTDMQLIVIKVLASISNATVATTAKSIKVNSPTLLSFVLDF